MEHEIKYAKWKRLVRMKSDLDNAIANGGKTKRELETLTYMYESEVNKVISSFYEEYNSILLRYSSDKIVRMWHAPRKRVDSLETAQVIISEVERIREVVKKANKCSKCHKGYIFECTCI